MFLHCECYLWMFLFLCKIYVHFSKNRGQYRIILNIWILICEWYCIAIIIINIIIILFSLLFCSAFVTVDWGCIWGEALVGGTNSVVNQSFILFVYFLFIFCVCIRHFGLPSYLQVNCSRMFFVLGVTEHSSHQLQLILFYWELQRQLFVSLPFSVYFYFSTRGGSRFSCSDCTNLQSLKALTSFMLKLSWV